MKQNIILVTGMSGAGKSSAITILEDLGYHCIDQFPVELLEDLWKIIKNSNDPRYQNIALATSAKDYQKFLNYFENHEKNVNVLFLDASNEKLLLRYKFTRRTHPFIMSSVASTLEEAIEAERELFNQISYRHVIRIDTTNLTLKQLRSHIESRIALEEKDGFAISIVSFGFKYGIPLDADLMFDVRFLPNPYWVEDLKEHTGDDADVYDFVMESKETKTYLKKLIPFLDYNLKQYKISNKNHVTIAIGCTGGKHRSVSLTNYLYDYYKEKYTTHKGHRDMKVSV